MKTKRRPTMVRANSLEALGWRKFLDLRVNKHNGIDANKFHTMLENGATISEIARRAKVSRQSVYPWYKAWERDQEHD